MIANLQWANTLRQESWPPELNLKANLEVVVATLHENVYNVDKHGRVNQLKHSLDEIETRKAKGAAVRARVKW